MKQAPGPSHKDNLSLPNTATTTKLLLTPTLQPLPPHTSPSPTLQSPPVQLIKAALSCWVQERHEAVLVHGPLCLLPQAMAVAVDGVVANPLILLLAQLGVELHVLDQLRPAQNMLGRGSG